MDPVLKNLNGKTRHQFKYLLLLTLFNFQLINLRRLSNKNNYDWRKTVLLWLLLLLLLGVKLLIRTVNGSFIIDTN